MNWMTSLCYSAADFRSRKLNKAKSQTWLVGWQIAWDVYAWATLTQEKEWVIRYSEGWWFDQSACWRYWAPWVNSKRSEWAGGTFNGSLCQHCMNVCVNGRVVDKTKICCINTLIRNQSWRKWSLLSLSGQLPLPQCVFCVSYSDSQTFMN